VIWERYNVECTLRREADRRLYRARDLRTEGPPRVIVEVLERSRVEDETWLARFERRISEVRGFSHPNAQQLVRYRQGKRFAGVVKRWIGGATLAHHARGDVTSSGSSGPGGPLPLPQVARMIADLGAALDALHEAGQVHGAVHPGNVVLQPIPQPDGGPRTYKAILMGLDDGPDVAGSPPVSPPPRRYSTYVAPEVGRDGGPPSPETDRFSLGALAYRFLTGEDPAWPPKSPMQVLERLDPAASAGIMAYLKRRPSSRPTTAALLGQTLGRIGGAPEIERPPGPPPAPPSRPDATPGPAEGSGWTPVPHPPAPRPDPQGVTDSPMKIALLNLALPGMGYRRIGEIERAEKAERLLLLWLAFGAGIFVHIHAAIEGYILTRQALETRGPPPNSPPNAT